MPGPTIHHRMPEPLTYSFKHLFELTRELSISSDQVADHSRNDLAAVTLKTDPSTWRGRR